jgi:hypothetical protein
MPISKIGTVPVHGLLASSGARNYEFDAETDSAGDDNDDQCHTTPWKFGLVPGSASPET